MKRARQFFRAAVRKRLLADNPMQDVKAPAQVNTARAFYVTREATERIIAACPDAEWRLIVALARYGGLRTPSETFALTWADVDWERNRIRVPSPKTACHAGRESRMHPLVSRVAALLGSGVRRGRAGDHPRYRPASNRQRQSADHLGADMQTGGGRVVGAGFPEHAGEPRDGIDPGPSVARRRAWIGNSAPIAARHYLQVTDADFDRAAMPAKRGAESGAAAAQNPAQQRGGRDSGKLRQETTQAPEIKGLC